VLESNTAEALTNQKMEVLAAYRLMLQSKLVKESGQIEELPCVLQVLLAGDSSGNGPRDSRHAGPAKMQTLLVK
jgi:hypothetical protein